MDLLPGKARRAASNPWFILVSGIGSVIGLMLTALLGVWPEAFRAERLGPYVLPIVAVVCVFLSVIFVAIIYNVTHTLRAFRFASYKRHEISHTFRNQHGKQIVSLGTSLPPPSMHRHAIQEVEVLNTVTQKIAAMYREFTGAPCMVEVFACDESKGEEYCFVIARSENGTERDRDGEQRFLIHKDANTAFVEARVKRPAQSSYFLAGDLGALSTKGEYHDQRDNWQHLYQSRLVVPIRYRAGNQEIGFLSVDTRSRHRFNHTFHVEILASLADETYVFLHVTRARLLEELRPAAGVLS